MSTNAPEHRHREAAIYFEMAAISSQHAWRQTDTQQVFADILLRQTRRTIHLMDMRRGGA